MVRIFKSGPFRHRGAQRFLEYIVNETLAGRGKRLKGYNSLWKSSIVPTRFDSVTSIPRAHGGRATP